MSRERVLSTFYDLFLLVKGRSGVVVVLFTAKRSSEITLILVVCFFCLNFICGDISQKCLNTSGM